MANAIEEAKALLAAIESDLPYKLNEITTPDTDDVLATVRKADGYPAILPHPEAQSILAAPRGVFNFLNEGPRVLAELLAIAESNNTPKATNRRNSEENAPE